MHRILIYGVGSNMKRLIICFLIACFDVFSFANKPLESITNYNVMLAHGAYGAEKGFPVDDSLKDAYAYGGMLGNGASLGAYDNDGRITYWLSKNVLEEKCIGCQLDAKTSYIYNWRSFSNPANTSLNNAYEMGDRTWNKEGWFGKRRALFEEAQEVKARFVMDPSDPTKNIYGQVALDSMRHNPDLYRQLASRYILIGHSMGGIASREWIQNSDFIPKWVK